MLTMILGGLWHGAAWTFVLWGIYQGLLLVGHRLASPWLDRIQPSDPIDRACWKPCGSSSPSTWSASAG